MSFKKHRFHRMNKKSIDNLTNNKVEVKVNNLRPELPPKPTLEQIEARKKFELEKRDAINQVKKELFTEITNKMLNEKMGDGRTKREHLVNLIYNNATKDEISDRDRLEYIKYLKQLDEPLPEDQMVAKSNNNYVNIFNSLSKEDMDKKMEKMDNLIMNVIKQNRENNQNNG